MDLEELLKEYGENANFADRELELWEIEEKIKDVIIASIDWYGGSHVLQNDYTLVLMIVVRLCGCMDIHLLMKYLTMEKNLLGMSNIYR